MQVPCNKPTVRDHLDCLCTGQREMSWCQAELAGNMVQEPSGLRRRAQAGGGSRAAKRSSSRALGSGTCLGALPGRHFRAFILLPLSSLHCSKMQGQQDGARGSSAQALPAGGGGGVGDPRALPCRPDPNLQGWRAGFQTPTIYHEHAKKPGDSRSPAKGARLKLSGGVPTESLAGSWLCVKSTRTEPSVAIRTSWRLATSKEAEGSCGGATLASTASAWGEGSAGSGSSCSKPNGQHNSRPAGLAIPIEDSFHDAAPMMPLRTEAAKGRCSVTAVPIRRFRLAPADARWQRMLQ